MPMTKIYVGDVVQWNGKNWLIRGLNAEKGVYVTESKMSFNRAYIPFSDLAESDLEFAKKEKVKAPKAEKAEPKKRETYSKSRGLDMRSEFIKNLAKDALCSYNYNNAHASLEGDVLHVERHGKKQDFINAYKRLDGENLAVYCENKKGDKCIIAYDPLTLECSLIVIEKAN